MNSNDKIGQLGFAVASYVTPSDEIAALSDHFYRTTLRRSKAGIRHALKDPAIAAFASKPQLHQIATAVLGVGAFPFRATLFDKSPEANWLVVWHQDTALPLAERLERPGWGPWSVKDGVKYAHAPAEALARVLALRVHLTTQRSKMARYAFCPARTIAAFSAMTPSTSCPHKFLRLLVKFRAVGSSP